jgi:2-iminobutanoate/2-iminopropanoate deaminase
MKRRVSTDRAAQAVGPYSQAIVAAPGRLVFCAGQIGLDPVTGELVKGGVLAELEQAMRNLRAILEAAGASLGDVVKTTLHFADLGDFARVNDAYAAHFSEPFPARAAVQAAALPKGARIEIEAIAVLEA